MTCQLHTASAFHAAPARRGPAPCVPASHLRANQRTLSLARSANNGDIPRRSASPRRKAPASYLFEEEPEVTTVVEEADASSHGMFNAGFKNALASALQRSGPSALLQGQERLVDENRISDQEEVLKAAIIAAKSTLLKLNLVRNEVEKAIETETKQVERLMFALDKARNDAAYYKGLSNMLEDGRSD